MERTPSARSTASTRSRDDWRRRTDDWRLRRFGGSDGDAGVGGDGGGDGEAAAKAVVAAEAGVSAEETSVTAELASATSSYFPVGRCEPPFDSSSARRQVRASMEGCHGSNPSSCMRWPGSSMRSHVCSMLRMVRYTSAIMKQNMIAITKIITCANSSIKKRKAEPALSHGAVI